MRTLGILRILQSLERENQGILRANFHSHTRFSDGEDDPVELSLKYFSKGYVNAITDHDTFEGVKHILKTARQDPDVEAILSDIIGGVEVTTSFKEHEIHILGLGYTGPSEEIGRLESLMAETNQNRLDVRFKNMNDYLKENNFDTITRDELQEYFEFKFSKMDAEVPDSVVFQRPDVYRAISWKFDLSEEEGRNIGKNISFDHYTSPPTEHALELMKESGLVTILAHPCRYGLNSDDQDRLIDMADGAEAFYISHKKIQTRNLLRKATNRNKLVSVGSDNHGYENENEKRNEFGVTYCGQPITVDNKDIRPLVELLKDRNLKVAYEDKKAA